MKAKGNHIYIAIIIGLGLWILFMETCNKCPKITMTTDTITTIEYDTIIHDSLIPKPIPYEVTLPPDTIRYVDSAYCIAIARSYYSRNIYNDTLQDDTSAFIKIEDTTYKNELQRRRLTFINRRPTKITTIINQSTSSIEAKNKFYVGVSVGRETTQFGIGVNAMLVTKKNQAYSGMYDIMNKDFYGTIYYNIKFK